MNPLVTDRLASQNANNLGLWCFLGCQPQQTGGQTIKLVIWDVTVLMWHHCNIIHGHGVSDWCDVSIGLYPPNTFWAGSSILSPDRWLFWIVHLDVVNSITLDKMCKKRMIYNVVLCFFSCDQAALQMVFSVRLSVCPSVCLSVCPSVRHTFLTMFPSSYHHEIFRSYYQWPT